MAALRDNNPLAYINQETEDYRKNRDEMFNQEIEKEIMEKFQVYDDDLERKRQQIEKYREEEELSLIEQYELLQQRREALEAKKEQAEKRWNKQRHQSEDNSKNFESKQFEGNKNGTVMHRGGYATITIEISRSKSGQNDLFRPKIIQS